MNERDNPYSTAYGGQMNASASYGSATAAGRAQTAAAPAAPGSLVGAETPSAAGDLVSETTTAGFTADVIQASRNQPVLVDFWAPWCGPCKQLTPVLEKVVREAKGRVRLVKLNIDEHPAIPGQMGIQSIPAVIAFVNGQPVDGFMGAVPESQVKQFIERIAGPAGADEAAAVEAALSEAKAALAEGHINRAAQGFSAILAVDPEHGKALAGMAECLTAAGRDDEAQQVIERLTDEQRKDPDVAALLARMAQAEEVAKLGDPNALEARLAANPDDHAARLDLAKILNVKGERAAAADHLLTIMRKDREWEDDGARRALLSFFEAWGPTDPATLASRRKLSSILFS